jgi:hypothetical protein
MIVSIFGTSQLVVCSHAVLGMPTTETVRPTLNTHLPEDLEATGLLTTLPNY